MPQLIFTESRVRDLKQQPKTTWYSHKGDKYPGLFLSVGQTTKTWYLKKRNPATSKTQTINLGRFPAMSLELARERAERLSSEIHNGTRGAVEMITLSDAFEYHVATKRKSGKLAARTERDYRSTMKNMSDFMKMRLENISHAALQSHLSDLTPANARLCRAIVSASFRAARKQRPTLYNPTEGIELPSATKRETLTEFIDLKRVWDAINKVTETRRMAWIVLMFTGIRSTNVRELRWDQVDLDAKTIHLPKMKNQLARTLPISEIVVAAIEKQVGKDAILVFPSIKEGAPIYHLDTIEGIVRQHDMRHHFTTAAGRAELPSYIIAFLRGDKMSADSHQMVAHYLGSVGSHAHVEAVSKVMLEQCGIPPASALEGN